jgi:Spy/CpxP family protein refolding chaperone
MALPAINTSSSPDKATATTGLHSLTVADHRRDFGRLVSSSPRRNEMKKGIVIAVGALAGLVLLGGFAASRMGHGGPERAYEHISKRVNALLDEVKATDEQRARVNQIKDQLLKEGVQVKQSERQLMQELLSKWDASQVDAAEVHTLIDQRVEGHRAFAQKMADALIQIHDILTPDQRAQLKQELQSHFKSHRHHGPGTPTEQPQ